MSFLITGLDPSPFVPLFGLSGEELEARGAIRMPVKAQPGYPCRVTLSDAPVGESVLLLNHTSRTDDTPYRATHAIFVQEGAMQAREYYGETPPCFDGRVLSLRGFDATGMMADAVLVQPGEAGAAITRMFDNRAIDEIDVHNAVRGCFAARTTRA